MNSLEKRAIGIALKIGAPSWPTILYSSLAQDFVAKSGHHFIRVKIAAYRTPVPT